MPEYRPGESIPESGVFLVTHDGHRSDHTVTLLKGGTFPQCSQCGGEVRFELVRGAVVVYEDADFARQT